MRRDDTWVIRYTDLVTDSAATLCRVRDFLEIDVSDPQVREIAALRTENPKPRALQFNTGKVTRFSDEMAEEDIRYCNKKLGRFIQRLGYQVDSG